MERQNLHRVKVGWPRRLEGCLATRRPGGFRPGYSLAEMIAVLVILAMVLTAVLSVYTRANRAAGSVLERIEAPVLPMEVLQLIARDLERVMGDDNVRIQVRNGFDNGFVTAEMTLRRTVEDIHKQEQLVEEIVWRAAYDYDSATPGLIVYRSYEGIGQEDKLLDQKRESLESNYPLIPICRGVTFFQIEIPKGEGLLDRWTDTSLPGGVKVTLSFANPYETVRGTLDVLEQEKTSRTIAIDKTRTIAFKLPAIEGGDANDVNDADDVDSTGQDEEADATPTRRTRR